ncbi:PepSY-associated TM helix domain-containing protein [Parahaliea mediterranea]|uniref:PepSY domain-containing protein n=1 Tax=Parahaliea mediterranea TaxID=651086 RepID=A0A939II22_9GAMM|nr:PepSY-associated TM helix domain-containing protein [Parahaliea mediterranea]MBN7796124.1 PepSY domain-containing protein [Parahaliea mediterranea]
MKEGFRQSMAWLHTWSGLVTGWVLFFVFVTGTAGYFDDEITRWMQPEQPLRQAPAPADNGRLAGLALDQLEQLAPGAAYWRIVLPHQSSNPRAWRDFAVEWETLPEPGQVRGRRGQQGLDPQTGAHREPVATRDTGGGRQLYRMHYALHYIDRQLAYYLVGVCTMLMLVAIVTGVITHKKIFKDFFTFRPGKGQRSWLDAHNVVSVMALPFFLMITYSGLLLFATTYMPAGVAALYGTGPEAVTQFFDELRGREAAAPVSRPRASVPAMIARAEASWGEGQVASVVVRQIRGGEPRVEVHRVLGGQVRFYDGEILRFHAGGGEPLPLDAPASPSVKTNETFRALHEGLFADTTLRWLYFIAGLLGCGMIGTGLVLWTTKRRQRQAHTFGFRLVEALNVATIAGLPAGVAAYFWANRLLPVDFADRAAWEVNCLFLIWGEALIYAYFRDTRKAWTELLWLAAGAYALLPLLNALTTDKHLVATLAAGDWVLAGFDLTVLALGGIFAWAAIKVGRRTRQRRAGAAATGTGRSLAAEAL